MQFTPFDIKTPVYANTVAGRVNLIQFGQTFHWENTPDKVFDDHNLAINFARHQRWCKDVKCRLVRVVKKAS